MSLNFALFFSGVIAEDLIKIKQIVPTHLEKLANTQGLKCASAM